MEPEPPQVLGNGSPASATAFRHKGAVGSANRHRLPASAEVAGVVAAQRKDKGVDSPHSVVTLQEAAEEWLPMQQSGERSEEHRLLVDELWAAWRQVFETSNDASSWLTSTEKKMGADIEKKLVKLVCADFAFLDEEALHCTLRIAHCCVLREFDATKDDMKTLVSHHWDGNSVWITSLRRLVEMSTKQQRAGVL